MDQFDFCAFQLAIGFHSKPAPESQSIAQQIVEQHILNGYSITPGVIHLANDPADIDPAEAFDPDQAYVDTTVDMAYNAAVA